MVRSWEAARRPRALKLRGTHADEADEATGVLTIEITGPGRASDRTCRKIVTDVYTKQDRSALGPVQRRVSTPSRPKTAAAASLGGAFRGQTSRPTLPMLPGAWARRALAEAGSW